jgi:CheY-like chemotaxis protein
MSGGDNKQGINMPRILIIDDSIRDVLKEYFEGEGYSSRP